MRTHEISVHREIALDKHDNLFRYAKKNQLKYKYHRQKLLRISRNRSTSIAKLKVNVRSVGTNYWAFISAHEKEEEDEKNQHIKINKFVSFFALMRKKIGNVFNDSHIS